MADRIRLKRSDVPDLIPHATELLAGELALNYADMVLYSLDADGNVKPVTSSGGGAAYSFWVKQGTQGQTVFNGTDDNGRLFGVNLEGFDVTLNGVQLDPNADYTLDADNLTLTNPLLRDGDTVVIRCLVAGRGNLGFYNITTQDVGTVGANPFGRWTSASNLTLDNQYDVNWSIKAILDFMQEQIDAITDGMSQGWLCLTKVVVNDRGAGVTNVEAFFESSSPSTTDGYVEFDINGTGDWKQYDQLTPQEQSDLKLFGGVGSSHVMFWAAESLASVPNVLVRHNFFVENEPTLVVEGPAVSPHTFVDLYPDECVGGGMDLPYATHDYVDLGDADLQAQIDALSAAGGYNDAWIQPAIDSGDNTTLTAANAYADTLFGNITHPAPPNLTPYATIAYSDAGDSTTLNSSKSYTDAAIGNITHPAPPDTKGFLKRAGDTTTGRLTHAGADIVVFTGELEYGGPGQPSGGGVTGKCTVMNLEPEGDRSPVNELKFIVPNSGSVRDFLNRNISEGIRTDLTLASASGEQRWTGKGAGWFSPNSTYHLSAEAVEGDTLSDGESVGVKAVEKAKYLLEGEVEDGGSTVTISPDEPAEKVDGDLWFDNAEDTMQLSVFHVDSSAWLPVAPPLSLEGRVSTGEAIQRQIVETLSTLDDYAKTDFVLDVKAEITTETDQKLLNYLPKSGGGVTGTISMGTNKITNLGNATNNKDAVNLEKLNEGLSGKVGNSGTQDLPASAWKIRARKTSDDGNYSYIDISGDKLHLYHVADPTNDEHAMSRGYADRRYQVVQEPLVIKTTGSMGCTTSNSPGSKQFCGLYNTAPGSATNANEWFGNWNAGMRVALDGMRTPDGSEFAQNQKFIFNGYVTVLGYDGKVYFKHAVDMIHRSGTDSYLTIHFTSRVPTYASGQYNSQDKYIVTIEGYLNKSVATLNIPDEEIE